MTAKRSDRETTDVVIRYWIVPNRNQREGGFRPMYSVGDHVKGSPYGPGLDREIAIHAAEMLARDEGRCFVGDYRVDVAPRDPEQACAECAP